MEIESWCVSMFDLNRIIANKSYRVSMPPETVFEEVEKFLCPIEIFPGCKEWTIRLKKGDRLRIFYLNPVYYFVVLNMDIKSSIAERIKLKDDYYKDRMKNLNIFIESKRNNQPYNLEILISDINKKGCICNAMCKPMLYLKLSSENISMEDVNEFMIQDSYYEVLQFLDQVFIGGLGAKPIEEPPVISHRLELLVNNTNRREITERIDSLLDEATGEILISGWIGTHFIPQLKELKREDITIRFITHKPQEAKGQPWRGDIEKAYEELCRDFGLENICIDPTMHGRMVIVDNKALIGSMDLNSYSLTGAHTEFAIYTDEPEIVRRLREQFNAKFKPIEER